MKLIRMLFFNLILFLSFFSSAYAIVLSHKVSDRQPVPVTVTLNNQYWIETISICNTTSQPIPLNDIEFDFNYAVTMPTSIWGQPWADWHVASQQGTQVVLVGSATQNLNPDPTCKNPLTIQFNAAPDLPAPTGPFVFKAAGVTPPPKGSGNLTVNMQASPATGLANPQVTVTGGGKTLQQTVNWGTKWQLTNLTPGGYTVTSSSVSNGTTTYTASPINVTVVDKQTVQANVVYTGSTPPPGSGNLTVNMQASPATGLANPQVTVTGGGKTLQQTVAWGTAWQLTSLTPGGYTVTSSSVSNGTTTYTAAPITVTVVDKQTVQANVVYSGSTPPPTGSVNNSTWAYDTTYNSNGQPSGTTPGLFANNIVQYNNSAAAGHKLTEVFSYGGDMEMYCKGSGGTSNSTPCTASNMNVFYAQSSAAAYFNASKNTPNPIGMFPIVDGVIGDTYLKTFNSLTQAEANIYADNVAKLYCADDMVVGVQFDLEPFDINQQGQAFFFAQIAKNFAGQHNGPGQPDPFNCVNANHPKGRLFSVFTYADAVNSKLAGIFNQYGNGYVIDSLYDLGDNDGGVVNSVAAYTNLVNAEVANMKSKAKTFQVKYQFGIPAAASVHEFESVNGKSTGFSQLDYVKAAINAINTNGVRTDPLFAGINLWGWNQRMFWSGMEFTPSIPNSAVLAYLATQL